MKEYCATTPTAALEIAARLAASLPSAAGGERREDAIHRVDLREVAAEVVLAAALAGARLEATLGVGVARCRATQVDDRSQVLLLLKRGAGDSLGAERAGDAAIQKRRGQLDRVAGHDARVQAVEPARSHRVPRSLLSHGMIVDAIALRFAERSIGRPGRAQRETRAS